MKPYRPLLTALAGLALCLSAAFSPALAAEAPIITQGPTNVAASAGAAVSFSVTVTGTAPLSYQWKKNGANITGATASTHTLPSVRATDIANYWVVVTNVAGAATSAPVSLRLLAAPAITQNPASQFSILGNPAYLQAAASGSEPLSYQWRLNGTNIAGATSPVYSISAVTTNDLGYYSLLVTNELGSAVSTDATITSTYTTPLYFIENSLSNVPRHLTTYVSFAGDGAETALTFSLAFNTNAVSLPTATLSAGGPAGQLPENTALLTDATRLADGYIGFRITLPAGAVLPAARIPILSIDWTLADGANLDQSGLVLADVPIETGARNINGLAVAASSTQTPRFVTAAPTTTPDMQTGLFSQVVTVSNPTGASWPGVRLTVRGLGNDSHGNAITVFNSVGLDLRNLPYIEYGPLAAGASVPLNVEYYVPDRTTVPAATFEVAALTALTVAPSVSSTMVQYHQTPEQKHLLDFATTLGRYYYVQYSGDSTNWNTSLPAIRGTGTQVQWLDNGPPRTLSDPASVPQRFYRVMLSN